MKEKMISATKLKAIIKGLPNDLLLECTHLGDWMDYSHLGDMMLRKKKDFFTGRCYLEQHIARHTCMKSMERSTVVPKSG